MLADNADPRIGNLLAQSIDSTDQAKMVIVGFPCDEGVVRNGGRSGASSAPEAIRRVLYRLTPDVTNDQRFIDLLGHTVDIGDVDTSGSLAERQEQLAAVISPVIDRGDRVVVLGGGHETSYGHFLAYVNAQKHVRIVNWDAHPDVRPLVDHHGHSGSPFRQALEHQSGICSGYAVVGLAKHSTSRAHLDYLRQHHAEVVFQQDVERAETHRIIVKGETTMLTFDLDVIDQSQTPGVSAPNAEGLNSALVYSAAFFAGRQANVRSMDVVECNPRFDVDGKTARVAAQIVWHFFRGTADQP